MDANQLYGQDMLLDDQLQAVIAANGEAVPSKGIQTVLQDIKLRLFTPLGSLFYDQSFGSRIMDFVRDENTEGNRMALTAEVSRRIGADPRVVSNSATCRLVSWDHTGITLAAEFSLIEDQHAYNLVIEVNDDMQMVIRDVNPG